MRFTRNLFLIIISSFVFSGCAAMQVALEHKDLEVQTIMSDTVFLEITDSIEKTVYLDIKNTSDKEVNIIGHIKEILLQKGYTLASSPKEAYYFLQGNTLFVGETDPSAATGALANGYGGALAGAGVGALTTGSYGGLLALGIVGGLAEVVANSLTKNVTYTIITDLQIYERSEQVVSQRTKTALNQGSSTTIKQSASSKKNRRTYQTRVVSTANQVNLKYEEAKAIIEQNLARSIAGIF